MIPILSALQSKEADSFTIKSEGISSVQLMDRAALACTNAFLLHYPAPTPVLILIGPGNNGGDGLCMARLLADKNRVVSVCIIGGIEKISADAKAQYNRLFEYKSIKWLTTSEVLSLQPTKDTIIIDAIFGSGLTRRLEEPYLSVIKRINSLNNTIISIDLPSGMLCDPEPGINECGVKADYTFILQTPKYSCFMPDSAPFFGEWEIVDFGLNTESLQDINRFMLTRSSIASMLPARSRFSHKGSFGHALLIAGSYGMMGAAVLAAKGCLRGGTGLLTVSVPDFGFNILQSTVPEAILSRREDIMKKKIAREEENTPLNLNKYSAIGIGPGLGSETGLNETVHSIFNSFSGPVVIDADGLNLLSSERWLLDNMPHRAVLTPHPGEFLRLAQINNIYKDNRQYLVEAQRDFAAQYGIILVLKGHHTTIAMPDGKLYINNTGNSALATAGSGDVLTGIILSLLAQGCSPEHSAIVGVYIHGMVADVLTEETDPASVLAGDLCEAIGKTYKILRL